jgi:hypothetical protein
VTGNDKEIAVKRTGSKPTKAQNTGYQVANLRINGESAAQADRATRA